MTIQNLIKMYREKFRYIFKLDYIEILKNNKTPILSLY